MRLLTPEEIEALTEYRRPGKQCEALLQMGIPYRRCPRTGRPKVLYEDLKGETRTRGRTTPAWEKAS